VLVGRNKIRSLGSGSRFVESRCPSRGTRGRDLPSFGGRQTGAALSKLAPAFNSQPDKPQYNLRKGSAQGSGTESSGHIKLGRAVGTQAEGEKVGSSDRSSVDAVY
jgi:hypothetical protein